jgi:hypothetical protein
MRGRLPRKEHHRGQWQLDWWRRQFRKQGAMLSLSRFRPDLNSLSVTIGPFFWGGIDA